MGAAEVSQLWRQLTGLQMGTGYGLGTFSRPKSAFAIG